MGAPKSIFYFVNGRFVWQEEEDGSEDIMNYNRKKEGGWFDRDAKEHLHSHKFGNDCRVFRQEQREKEVSVCDVSAEKADNRRK